MSLRRQVILAMALALSPLLILGGLSVLSELEANRAEHYRRLENVSREGMSSVNAAIHASRLALRVVASDDRQPSCSRIGETLAATDLPIRNVIRFNADGEVICNAVGEGLIGHPMPDPGWNERLLNGMEQIESSAYPGMALGDPVIWILRRNVDAAGSYTGALGVTLSLQKVAERFPDVKSATGLRQALVTSDGTVVGSELIDRLPAEWLTNEAILERKVRKLDLPQGRQLDAVLMLLAAEGVWMVTPSAATERRPFEAFIVLLIPLLAYLAALLASTWIIDTLVLRWLERLRSRISDMRRTSEVPLLADDFMRASSDFQQVAKAFDELTGRVTVHEADMQQALDRMTGAFRETHHRVKNNLQVMLSMLKLQVRGEQRVETQHVLRIAAQRVSMMAAVHHSLLDESHLDTVDAGDLIEAICSLIQEQQDWGEESRHIRRDVFDGSLPADLAVPLAMFIQEAFDILCPATRKSSVIRDLRLSLTREAGEARLRLSCARDPTPDEDDLRHQDTSLFLAAFARQLDGTVEQQVEDGESVLIELNFPIEISEPDPEP